MMGLIMTGCEQCDNGVVGDEQCRMDEGAFLLLSTIFYFMSPYPYDIFSRSSYTSNFTLVPQENQDSLQTSNILDSDVHI